MNRILSSFLVVVAVVVTGCATLPPPKDRVETTALTDTDGTRLGRGLAPLVAANPDKTGIHAMPDPRDAFGARVLLAGVAEKSLDAQYFIWNGDQVGYLLLQALWQAAERGVRVRLLLDDLGTKGLDPTIAALDAHPNIKVRLYNPVTIRDNRALNFLTDFTRVNKRMHNKSFTVDNQATVVGGRNIADEYFGAGGGITFADLDVLAVGPAVAEVSREFDVYWNSASAYPAPGFVGAPAPDAADLEARFAANRADPGSIAYLDAVRATPLVRELLERKLALEWATAEVVYDDPAKTLDTTERTDVLLFPELVRKIGRPEKTLDIVSPYFVPGDGVNRVADIGGEKGRDRAHPHQLARRVRREVGTFGLREAPPEPARGWCTALRDQADREGRGGGIQPPVWFRLVLRAACQDACRRRQPDLCRLVQLRSAFGTAQHRNGPGAQQSGAGARSDPILRCRSAEDCLRGPADARRQQPRMDRTDYCRREALRHRAGDGLDHAHESRLAVDSAHRMAAVGGAIAVWASEAVEDL